MKEIWDEVWAHKKAKSDYSLRLYSYLAFVAKKLPARASVIEVGCGSGLGLSQFEKENKKAMGIDISFEALKLAMQTSNANLTRADGFFLPFKDETFDLAYNSGVIEHFEYPKDLALLVEMKRVTKKGGSVLVIVPNKNCVWYRILKSTARKVKKWEFGYERDYSHDQLVNLFYQAGLEPKDRVGLMILPPLATNNWEFVPENIRRKLMAIDRIFPNKHLYAYAIGVLGRKG
ncbi:MAG: class I SAM-dependent methyltransferase [Thermoplasmata archaeon]|nr:MAG: class I SAM-dependent methyltransferase [Thermoplasmata archaeon]